MNTVKSLLSFTPRQVLDLVISNPRLRKTAVNYGKKLIYKSKVIKPSVYTKSIKEAQYQAIENLVSALDRAISENLVSKSVIDRLLKIFIGKIFMPDKKITIDFHKKYNMNPPGLLVISPEKRCNLNCTGCYAASTAKSSEHLDFDTVSRIVSEKTKLWSSNFTVISGGEPFMWKSDGKTILDLFAKHDDNYFMMYTNGTLITKEVAKRMAELGNISPAISVEGFEEKTDKRRGKGVFKKILQSMENLREAGVLFGISVTATKENVEEVLSDEFIDFFFNKQKAMFGWMFQYMPIGRAYTLDLMVTPEQRKWMLEREQNLIFDKKLFFIDFWNGGIFSSGCIAGGRPGGYFYVDWNGNIAPCAFLPFSNQNIKDIYKNGGNISDALNSPLFKKVREFQSGYGYLKTGDEIGNWYAPCTMRDHYDIAYNAIKESNAFPMDETGKEAINDPLYREGLLEYGKKFQELTNEMWKKRLQN